jgi:cupin fold WbuC family metalloprotein
MSVRGFSTVTPAVFQAESDPVTVDREQIAATIAVARAQPNGRARLLLHENREDSLHEMIIALPATSCDHPHINYKSGKSFTAVSGQFAVMCFSDDGSDATAIVLSAGEWPGACMARLQKPTWHTIIPLEGDTAFIETVVGPFMGNYFAEWFPPAGTEQRPAAEERLRRLARDAADRLSHHKSP